MTSSVLSSAPTLSYMSSLFYAEQSLTAYLELVRRLHTDIKPLLGQPLFEVITTSTKTPHYYFMLYFTV